MGQLTGRTAANKQLWQNLAPGQQLVVTVAAVQHLQLVLCLRCEQLLQLKPALQ
jgi:hypothetical protein